MANREQHIPAGIVAPWIVLVIYMILQKSFPYAFYDHPWILVVFFMSFLSFSGERIPDTFEPPDNPRHRGLIHWFGFICTLYLIIFLLTSPILPLTSLSYEGLFGLLIISFLSGYASHFILDYILTG